MSEISPVSTTSHTTERKRNNSIIPIEFRNDTSDGGMERAALATVFGVRDYTESKIFWNADEQDNLIYNHSNSEDFSIYSTSTLNNASAATTTATTTTTTTSSFKPVVQHLLQRNSSKKSYTSAFHQRHNTTVQQQPQQSSVPASTAAQAALPIIPVVSEFGDIWNEVNSHYKPKRAAAEHHETLTGKDYIGYSSLKIQVENNNEINPPADLSDFPLALFDLIKSDENRNFIIWGIVKSTTIPPTAPSATSIDKEDDTATRNKKKLRWSSAQQIIPGSLKIIKKAASTSFHYNNGVIEQPKAHITSTAEVEEDSRVIEAATIEKLIEKLTISLDYTFMTDFFLIFRIFMTPLQLCKFLILRFRWSIENNDEERCIVRVRTFVVMRHWLLNYFVHDFIPSRELRIVLTSFLNAMPFHPLIKQSPRDQRIIKGLKRVVRRLKKIYFSSSSSANRVQVIGPPPPTLEQERVAAMVKDKLSQSIIRQKTLNIVDGIHVDARHSSNTAVKNKQLAPVVVIGNYPASAGGANSISSIRRRGSSVSSYHHQHINPNSLQQQQDNSYNGSKEWSNITAAAAIRINQPEYQARNSSDNSLDSALSPGTSDDELTEYDDDDEDDEEEDESLDLILPTDIRGGAAAAEPHITSDELSHKLEKLRQQQEEEDERKRAEFFLATYSTNPALATAAALQQQQGGRTISFYSAQLAIPSTASTPDIYYPQSDFDKIGGGLNNSTSYNSMAAYQQSINESEVMTPLTSIGGNDSSRYNSFHTQLNKQQDDNSLRNQRASKVLVQNQDPRSKPLPALNHHQKNESIASSIASYAKSKQLPKGPPLPNDDEKAEVWRYSTNSKQLQEKEELRHCDSNLTENTSHTPRSRIVEIDIAHNHHPNHSSSSMIQPPLPTPHFIHQQLPPSPTQQYRKSLVPVYSTSLMAQQFCLIEKAILLDINWEELVDCKWTKMSTSSSLYQPPNKNMQDSGSSSIEEDLVNHSHVVNYSRKKRLRQQEERNNDASERGIEKAINRFNAVCQWVSSEIVQTRQLEDRVKLIEKFIRLAKKCKLYCNFTTLIQILLGLQSSSVSRLEKTWPLVRKREMKILQELSTFTSPTKNWKNIRDSMTQVAEEYGESPTEIQVQVPQTISKKNKKLSSVTIKLPFGGCIPFLGIYLSDLVFNAELPSYLPNNARYGGDSMMDKVLSQPLVHFRKHRITATVIKRVLVFKNLAKRYSFEESNDPLLYSTCFKVASLDSDAIYKMSCEIE